MAHQTEQLTVQIRTVADTSGAREASRAIQEVTRSQQVANDLLRTLMNERQATMRNYENAVRRISSEFGTAPTLRPGAFGIGAGGGAGAGRAGGAGVGGAAGGVGGPGSDVAGAVRGGLIAFAGVSSGLYLAQNLLQGVVSYLGDSIQLLREHERRVAGTTAAYASWSAEIKNLDAAFTLAGKSSERLQLTIGRLAEPSVLRGLKAVGITFEFINSVLTGTAKLLSDIEKNPVWKAVIALAVSASAMPGIGRLLRDFTTGGAGIEQAERERARQIADRQNRRLLEINQLPGTTPPKLAAQINVTDIELADRRNRRLREINELPGPSTMGGLDTARTLARLAYLDQVDAAVREIQSAQQRQVDLERESVDLAAQEAQIRLSMLPTQERLVALQRQVTEQQIRASIAALPANEALDNARAAAEHARLIVQDFSQPLERRQAALRESINLQMRTLPGLELRGFEANEPVRLAGQAATRVGLEEQLFQVTQEGILAQTTLAQETNRLLGVIATQKSQAIQLTINLSPDQFRNDVYSELIDANAQSQTPPATQSSAVRRSGPS